MRTSSEIRRESFMKDPDRSVLHPREIGRLRWRSHSNVIATR